MIRLRRKALFGIISSYLMIAKVVLFVGAITKFLGVYLFLGSQVCDSVEDFHHATTCVHAIPYFLMSTSVTDIMPQN